MAVEDCSPAARLMMCCILSLLSSLGGIGSPLYARARSRSICPKASPSVHLHTVLLSDTYNKQKLANDVVNCYCYLGFSRLLQRTVAPLTATLFASRQTFF